MEVRRNLRKKEQELKSVQQVTERWRAEILARVARARELGLIPQGSAQPVNTERAIELLRGVISSAGNETRVTETTVSRAVSELTTLQQEESQVSQELSGLRRRLAEMSQLRSTAADFRGALEVQRDRLKVSEWVSSLKDAQHICPIQKEPAGWRDSLTGCAPSVSRACRSNKQRRNSNVCLQRLTASLSV